MTPKRTSAAETHTTPLRLVIVSMDTHLASAAARARFMEAHRPAWVRAWRDVTDDPGYTNARLARRRP